MITSIASPVFLPFVSTGCTDTLLASCGLDRRVILWTLSTLDTNSATTSSLSSITEEGSGPVVLEGQVLLSASSKYRNNSSSSSADDIYRSTDGPLTALVISSISASLTGSGCSLFVAAAAAGKLPS